jgi:hypothetical protein
LFFVVPLPEHVFEDCAEHELWPLPLPCPQVLSDPLTQAFVPELVEQVLVPVPSHALSCAPVHTLALPALQVLPPEPVQPFSVLEPVHWFDEEALHVLLAVHVLLEALEQLLELDDVVHVFVVLA